ncbi:MAG: hypothetical protein OXR66_05620 [Candidatus Woesearchaeota archaeon]|nr:hypothetical protein [Candidatus Woesearchaeota archaeon]
MRRWVLWGVGGLAFIIASVPLFVQGSRASLGVGTALVGVLLFLFWKHEKRLLRRYILRGK